MLYLLNALLGYRGNPAVDPVLWQKVEDATLGFKFWYTQPTPPGITDDMWYWSENHQIIFHTLEYLAGQTFPDRTFTTTGMTGAEHMAHARHFILNWFEHKSRFGFDEWHSNVYYQKDVTPLLTLVEYAHDPEIANGAAIMLDRFLLDIALNSFRGTFGATHGRTYKKDKMTAFDEDTYALTKLLFDTSEDPVPARHRRRARRCCARAKKYRLPQVILGHRAQRGSLRDRERMGIPIDEFAPLPIDRGGSLIVDETGAIPPPPGPYGFDFRDEANLPIFWSMSALTVWSGAADGVRAADTYGLWDSELFQPFLEIRDAVGIARVRADRVAGAAARRRGGLLKEVNTYTYRTPDVPALERAGLPQGIARQPVPLVAGDLRRQRAGLHHAPGHPAAPDARLERRRRARLLDRHRVAAAHRAARERRDPSLRAAVHRRARRLPSAHALRALHARLLSAGPLRRGRARRPLDLRPQGQRLHRALLVAHAGLRRPRTRRREERHDAALRPRRGRRTRRRVDRRVRQRERLGFLRGVPGRDPQRRDHRDAGDDRACRRRRARPSSTSPTNRRARERCTSPGPARSACTATRSRSPTTRAWTIPGRTSNSRTRISSSRIPSTGRRSGRTSPPAGVSLYPRRVSRLDARRFLDRTRTILARHALGETGSYARWAAPLIRPRAAARPRGDGAIPRRARLGPAARGPSRTKAQDSTRRSTSPARPHPNGSRATSPG